jgi:hypothetical protein
MILFYFLWDVAFIELLGSSGCHVSHVSRKALPLSCESPPSQLQVYDPYEIDVILQFMEEEEEDILYWRGPTIGTTSLLRRLR